MTWRARWVATVQQAPHLAAEQHSIAVVLPVALLAWKSSVGAYLIAVLGFGVLGTVAKAAAFACERRWGIDLDARGAVWDSRHWVIWGLWLTVSVSLATLFGLMLTAFIEQFVK